MILHLRDDAKEFLDEWRLRQIVRNYSDHIAVPILLQASARAPAAKDEAEPKAPEQINDASALWTRPKAEITDEQYKEFYHHVAHAFDDPWARLHVQAEGVVSYRRSCSCLARGRSISTTRSVASASSCTSGGCSSPRISKG